MECAVRPALPGDTEAIAALERDCFSLPRDAAWIASSLPLFLVAAAGEELLGYADMLTVLDEGYMGNIAVVPACRRMGVGRALMESLLERGRSLRLAFLTLEVRESNAAAISLYAELGFTEVGRRKKYYEMPSEDAILMTYFYEEKEQRIC